MSKTTTLSSLNCVKRSIVRQLRTAIMMITEALVAHLDMYKENVQILKNTIDEILDATDFKGKTELQIKIAENMLTDEWQQALTSTVRVSLNASLVGDGNVAYPLVKLPNIPVPKFDDNIKNFTEWRSLFEVMIDRNKNLKPMQKLYYLKQSMTADAKNLLHDFTLEELDVDKMLPLITYLIVTKLPSQIRQDWENSNLDYSTYPLFDKLPIKLITILRMELLGAVLFNKAAKKAWLQRPREVASRKRLRIAEGPRTSKIKKETQRFIPQAILLNFVYKLSQLVFFQSTVVKLRNGEKIEHTSLLATLNSFFDLDDVLCFAMLFGMNDHRTDSMSIKMKETLDVIHHINEQ
ncbi:hypothetical protein PGB90_007430 [Kerria lacca]